MIAECYPDSRRKETKLITAGNRELFCFSLYCDSFPNSTEMSEFFTSHLTNVVEVRWYQWEFLRRNPQYQDEFGDFSKAFGEWIQEKGFWFDKGVSYIGDDMKFFVTRIVPTCKVICEKWQILNPISPGWTFDKFYGLYEFRDGQYIPLPTGISAQEAKKRWNVKGSRYAEFIQRIRSGHARQRAITNGHVLQLEFDLRRPTDDLIADAKKFINSAKSSLSDLNVHSRARRRFKDYDDHLRAWDQCHPSRILSALPINSSTDSTPTIGSQPSYWVRDHLNAAKKLIYGSYRELR
jgi:hypothetical protein